MTALPAAATPLAVTPPVQPELVANLSRDMHRVEANGLYVYVAENIRDTSRLAIYDASASPVELASLALPGTALATARNDSIVYVITSHDSEPPIISSINVANPKSPHVLGTYEFTSTFLPRIMVAVGTRLYLGDDTFSGAAAIVNVSNPAHPVFVDYFGPGISNLFAVSGNRAVVGGVNTLPLVFDLTNPDKPKQINTINATGTLGQLSGNLLYSIRYGILSITDITKPADQGLLATYTIGDTSTVLKLFGSRMYIGDSLQGVRIYDVSNPTAIQNIASYQTQGISSDLAASNGRAYIVGSFGLQTLNIQGVSGPRALARFEFASTGSAQITAAQIEGNYAYVTALLTDQSNRLSGVLQVFDITNPAQPVVRASYRGLAYPSGLAVVGGIAYVADGKHLAIIDVSNPARLSLLHSLSVMAFRVRIAGTRAYVLGGGLTIVDVGNPGSPQILSHITGNFDAGDIDVEGNLAYISGSDGLYIFNVANPSSPALLGKALPDHYKPGPIQVIHSIVYSAGETLFLFEVSDPTAPTLIGSYSGAGQIRDIHIAGTTAYLAADSNGFQIAQLGTSPFVAPASNLQDGLVVERVAVGGGIALLGARSVVEFVDLTILKSPTLLGRVERVPLSDTLRISNGIAYIAAANAGLQIYDVHTPSNPRWLAAYKPSADFEAQILEIHGNWLYLGSPQRGIDVLDVSTPATPRLRNNVPAALNLFFNAKFQVAANRLYLGQSGGYISIYDLSNPRTPTFIRTYNVSNMNDFRVVGTLAYIARASGGLQIVNMSNAASPTVIKNVPIANGGGRVGVLGNMVYVADAAYKISLVNVTVPAQAAVVGSIYMGRSISYIRPASDFVVAGVGDGLSFLDAHNPSAPALRATVSITGTAIDIEVDRHFVYTASEKGLDIFWYAPASTVTVGTAAGMLNSITDQTRYSFPAGTFAAPTTVTHTPRYQPNAPATNGLMGIDHAFILTALDSSDQPVTPAQAFQIRVLYTEAERGSAIPSTLALYYWDGTQWVKITDSKVSPSTHTITATTDRTGLFAVLGDTYRTFVPLTQR
jgi:hypothetical protein